MASPQNSEQNKECYSIDEILILSQDKKLDKLLKTVVSEVRLYAENQIKHIRRGAEIGRALSAESDISKLLEMIVDEARLMTGADAGTLYIIDKEEKVLQFKILQNDTMGIRMGGDTELVRQLPSAPFTLPNVPLYKNGKENHSNVSSHSALTGEIINIPDVYDVPEIYETKGFDFTGPRNYDASTGYRSKSMLVIPLKNHENEIIGVLQLLNAKDAESGEAVAFSPEDVDLISSLASQAAVAMTNTQLIRDLTKAVWTIRELFYAFTESIAVAIEKKSQYTGGHIRRVVQLSMMIADKINEISEGPFKNRHLSSDELEELRLAAWMHDVGKITTPEYIVDKATKLQTVFDRIDIINTRFELIAQTIENKYLKRRIELSAHFSGLSQIEKQETEILDKKFNEEMQMLHEDLEFIRYWNNTGEFMSDEHVVRMKEIAGKTYRLNNTEYPYLTEDELKNLCIRKGTLTDEEREKIENHAMMTLEILNQLPFPENLKNVGKYASEHHLRLDGSGYPKELAGKDLALQSRIIAIADIFEALTAPDRPYKKPMKISQAVKILEFMKKDNHIDPDIHDLFIQKGLHLDYARKAMKPEQIDQ